MKPTPRFVNTEHRLQCCLSQEWFMKTDETPKLSREQRLAARLRENLRKRKAQSRAIGDETPDKPLGDTADSG